MPIETGNGHWVSRHTSRDVPTALTRLEQNPVVFLKCRQES